jgi:hypothetical protein
MKLQTSFNVASSLYLYGICNLTLSKNSYFVSPFWKLQRQSTFWKRKNASFFSQQKFDWKEQLHTMCTDGAPALLGNASGFATLAETEAPRIVVTPCSLRRQAQATKTLPASLKEVSSTAIKVTNSIKFRSLNHHIFKTFFFF